MSVSLDNASPITRIITASVNATIASAPPNGFDAFIFKNLPDGSGGDDSPYVLYDGACTVDGVQNCTAACADPSHIFSSLPTLANCIAAPFIAGNFSAIDETSQAIAKSFGITSHSLSVSAFNATYMGCLTEFAAANSFPFELDEGAISAPTLDPISLGFNLDGAVCSFATTTLDPDLGGIGIFLSFVLQISFALVGFFALLISSSLVYYVARWVLFFTGKNRSRSMAQAAQLVVRKHRLALISALEEFHRTQCFFGLAVQIAATIVMRTRLLDVNTSAQATSNFQFMQVVAFNSMLAIPFTLWYLSGNTERSWYTHLLSLATFSSSIPTYTVATAALQTTWVFAPVSDSSYPKCGGIDPSSLCGEREGVSSYTDGLALLLLPMASTFMVWLFLDQIWHRFLSDQSRRRILQNTAVSAIQSFFRGGRRRRLGWGSIWLLLKLCALGWFYFFITSQMGNLYAFLSAGSIQTWDWTIGQIVGVTIWVSPILEFVQLDISPSKHGFAHRLPKGWRVQTDLSEKTMATEPQWTRLDSVDDFFFGGTREPRKFETPETEITKNRDYLPLVHTKLPKTPSGDSDSTSTLVGKSVTDIRRGIPASAATVTQLQPRPRNV